MKTIPPLRPYQIEDLAFYMTQDRVINASDPGVGKTPSACVYSFHRWNNDAARSVWVQPKSLLVKNWEEMIRFTPFDSSDVAVLDGTPKQRKAILARQPKALFTTGEGLKKHLAEFPSDTQLLVTDEHHMLYGGHASQRTQAFHAFLRKARWLLAMSGTIIDGKLDTAYPLIQAIDPRYYGSHEQFMAQHALLDDYDNVIAWVNPEKIAKIVGRHGIRRTFEDAYGPESKVVLTETVEMSAKQRKMYDEFEQAGVLELDRCILDGSLPGVALTRLRQIMAHPEDVLGEDLTKGEVSGKDDRLLVHAEDHKRTGKPLMVFAALVKEQERIYRHLQNLGITTGLINGEVAGERRAEIDARFRRGDLQAIVASPATASLGYNWMHNGGQEVDHILFASMDFKDTSFLQAYRRCMRSERKTPLRVTVLQYRSSIDEKIFGILRNKSNLANSVDPTRTVIDLFKEEAA